jgi:DNA-binding NarL/FixJ family response regulator
MVRHLRSGWTLRFEDNAASAMAALGTSLPDAMIVDIGLPDDDGFALAGSVAELYPGLPILLISARSDPAVGILAERSSARGFIGKDAPPIAIAAAIDTVLRGERVFPQRAGLSAIPALTTRQTEVLALLQAGCSNKEMRYRLGIAERTVRAHLTDLFALLGVHSRTQALIRARELGLIA